MLARRRKIVVAVSQSLSYLSVGSAFVALALPVSAQTTALDVEQTTENIQTVTVTAQNRKQQAQAVPISFQVMRADQLDKLAAPNLGTISAYIPGLKVDGNLATQPIIFLRGVGNVDFGVGTDSPIGVYFDGVYAGKSGGSLLNFNDVERVEVLKGPQGTLFGRNSAGGAISIISKAPTKDFETDGHVRLGQYGLRYADGVLNVPLNADLSLRVSAVVNQSDGQATDGATGAKLNREHAWGTRATLLWNAPQRTNVLLTWEHEELNQAGRPSWSLIAPPAPGATPVYPANPNSFVDPRNSKILNDVVGSKETRKFDGLSLRVERPLAWADFTSTTAYRHFNSFNRIEEDGTNRINTYLDAVNGESNSTWQQEFKLSGKNDRADWVGGVSYYREVAHQLNQPTTYTDSLNTLFNNVAAFPVYSILNGAAQQAGIPVNFFGNQWQERVINKGVYKAQAAYGDVIWHMSPKLDLTTGIRFTHDDKQFSWYAPNRIADTLDTTLATLNELGFFPGLVQAGAISAEQAAAIQALLTQNQLLINSGASSVPLVFNRSWNDVSPRAVLTYRTTPDLMFYSSLAKGYQSGGFNAVAVASSFAPEKVVNLEVGIKSYFPEHKFLLNASLFAYKFTNLQSLNLIANSSNSGVPSYQITSSDQQARGLDLEARWQASGNLRFYFNSEYIDHKYDNYIDKTGLDLSRQPVGTPRFSAATGLDYVLRNVAMGKLDFTLQHAYTGATRCNGQSLTQGDCLDTPHFSVGGPRHRTDGRVGWTEGRGRWGVALFANNIFDKRYVYNVSNITAVFGTPFASVTPGRAVGFELTVRM